jgi:hypothetical protein
MEISIEHRLTEVEERSKSNTKRLNDMEKRQDDLDELVSTVKVLAVREENVENDVKEIKNDVKTLTSKPAKKWEGLIDKITVALIGAVIGLLLSQIGLQ